MSSNAFVIVGAGLAGAKAAQTLREEGFDGPVVLIGDEGERPYERPSLSKGHLSGKEDREKAFVHPESWYVENDVELRLGVAVTGLDPVAHEVTLADGSRIGYAKLLLATGASPRRLGEGDADDAFDNVHYLRTLRDSERLRDALKPGVRVAVIGAGWIGLEAAAAARGAGAEVTVLEAASAPLLRALGPEMAEVFAAVHRENGVELRFGVKDVEITGSGRRADGVSFNGGGERVGADVVVVGIGAVPNTELALAAGLRVEDGIITDERLLTSVPDVYAAGDVAGAYHSALGRHLRVEHWANALNQPQTAAKAMLGRDVVHDRLPYFYTDQFDLGMEYVGHAEPGAYDQVVVRGDAAKREFVAFWLAGGRVLAGMNVNVWGVTDAVKALIASAKPVDAAALADPAVPLESLIEA